MLDGEDTATPADPNTPKPAGFPLANLIVGGKDPRGRDVTDIFWAVEDFKIFRTSKGVSPFFSDDTDTAKAQRARYLSIGGEISIFNHLIFITKTSSARHMGEDDPEIVSMERELARCIALALTDQVEEARTQLKTLTVRLEKRIANRARVKHLSVNIFFFLAVWILAFFYIRVLPADSVKLFQFTIPDHIALAAIMGGFGALFSTAVGLKKMNVDASALTSMHMVYGFLRILVGVMGAIILYFGFSSGVFAGLLQADGTVKTPTADGYNLYWLAFVSVLAGFSERLVPNLLDSRADTALKDANPTQDQGGG